MSTVKDVPVAPTIWEGDTLDRKSDAEFLLNFLIGRIAERAKRGQSPSYVLNLDASWGDGKTFFLTRFAKYIEAQGHLVAFVNAWQDDHADDPLLAVMAAIEKVVTPSAGLKPATKSSLRKLASVGGQLVAAGAKGALEQAAIRYIGEDVTRQIQETMGGDVADIAKGAGKDAAKTFDKIFDAEGKALIERFNRAQRSIDDFRSKLKAFVSSVSGERKVPLFILVDELDRCRPDYAIRLLERMKHLFEIENVVFVLATDTRQLSHAVGAVYGATFDGGQYLTRFFDRTYSFEKVSRQAFVSHLLKQFPLDPEKISLPPNVDAPSFVSGGFDYFSLGLRDIEKSYDILRSAVSAWDLPIKIELTALLPLVIGYQQKLNVSLTQDFYTKMEELAVKKGPPSSLWQIPFRQAGRSFHEQKTDKINCMALFRDFASHSAKKLPDVADQEVSASYSRWIVQRLSEEFHQFYGGSHHPGDPPYSVILRYPELVRSAGRLLPKKHEPVRR